MTLDDTTPAGAAGVVVGSSTADAATLARDHDDVVISTYRDEVGSVPAAGGFVEVQVAPGCEGAVADAVRHDSRLTVRLVVAPEHHELLLDLLRAHGLSIVEIAARTAGVACTVATRPHGSTSGDTLLLQAVAAAHAAGSTSVEQTTARPARPTAGQRVGRSAAPSDKARPTPLLVKRLRQVKRQLVGRRRRTRLGLVLGGLAAVALVLVTLGSTSAVGLLVVLTGLGTAVVAAATGLAVLVLSRQVDRQTARLEQLQRRQLEVAQRVERQQAQAAAEHARLHQELLDLLETVAEAEATRGQRVLGSLQHLAQRRDDER